MLAGQRRKAPFRRLFADRFRRALGKSPDHTS